MNITAWHWVSSENRLLRHACEPLASVNEIAQQLPAGVYTTLRTYQRNKALRLGAHLFRLEQSAALSGNNLGLDKEHVQKLLRIAINETNYPEEIKIRIHIDLNQAPGDIFLLLEPLILPAESEQRLGGVALTRPMHRDNPLVKATGFITTAELVRKELPQGINEVLMTGENGEILEGLSSNFFVVKNNEVWTAAEGILAGITRDLVLKSIGALGIPLRLAPYPVEQLLSIEEAFITSTSRGVLPLKEIDSCVIGKICPGEITTKIRSDLERRVNEEIETI